MVEGDPDSEVEVWWSYCQEGADEIPFPHAFYSSSWHDARDELPELGERGRIKPRGKGPVWSELAGVRPCGDARVWRVGGDEDTPGLVLDALGVPQCCRPPIWIGHVELVASLVAPATDGTVVELVAGLADDEVLHGAGVVELVAELGDDEVLHGADAVELVAGLGDDELPELADVELVAELVETGPPPVEAGVNIFGGSSTGSWWGPAPSGLVAGMTVSGFGAPVGGTLVSWNEFGFTLSAPATATASFLIWTFTA